MPQIVDKLLRVKKLISIDYYDGTLEGMLKLTSGETCYYELLASNHSLTLRVFALYELEENDFKSFVRLVSPFVNTRKKYTYLFWNFGSIDDRDRVQRYLDEIKPTKLMPVYVIACDSLEGRVERAFSVSGKDTDWLRRLTALPKREGTSGDIEGQLKRLLEIKCGRLQRDVVKLNKKKSGESDN